MSECLPKTLSQLNLVSELSPDADLLITGISIDSRQVKTGDLFIGLDGVHHKGVDFVEQASACGAVAALVDSEYQNRVNESAFTIPVIAVEELRYHVGHIASELFGNPSEKLKVIGITGTNGKTSCAHFISTALETLGVRSAVIGTIGNGLLGQLQTATHTTPDAVSLQIMLADFVSQGAKAVVMEVSSHALEQGRVDGVKFDAVAYTNLSRDHLDYHGTMDNYALAKARLFMDLPSSYRVLNCEDDRVKTVITQLEDTGLDHQTFGLETGNDYLSDFTLAEQGVSMDVVSHGEKVHLQTSILGQFNLYNLLLSFSVLKQLGYSVIDAAAALEKVEPVPGRMESLSQSGVTAVIDYAHTPDALEKALKACREHVENKLWVVFGCGGDRDTGKRAAMAKIAEVYADCPVATSDNPRTEDPDSILDMVMEGFDKAGNTVRITDRAEAIRYALENAQSGDLVLVAGKGHEDYQEINGVRHHFSDREQVEAYFSQANCSGIGQTTMHKGMNI